MLFGACAATADAQETSKLDVGVGYSFLHDYGPGGPLFLPSGQNAGWVAAVTTYVHPAVGLTGEVGGTYHPIRGYGGPGGGDLWVLVHTLMAGATIRARTNPSVRLFGQLLAGPVFATHAVYGGTDSHTYFALQPGGGADIAIGPKVAVRAEADYRLVHVGLTGINDNVGELRLVAGVVFRR